MRARFKPHLEKMQRARTSTGRDMLEGWCLDRNERVTEFPDEILAGLYRQLPKFILNTYPDTDYFYEKLAKVLGLGSSNLFVTTGSTEGIKVLFEALARPGDRVVALEPTYPMYNVYSDIFQTQYHTVPFSKNLTIDVSSFVETIDKNTALVLLANPNLPVESMLSVAEIKMIANKCRTFDSVLVIDEAYHLFGADSAMELLQEYDNLVILRSFSKAYGLAGIRLGYMMSQETNIEYLSKTRSLVEASGTSMAIATYMLENPELVASYVNQVAEGARFLQDSLTTFGVRWHGGHVTNGILVFLPDNLAVNQCVQYLRDHKIYVRGDFKPPYDCCFRVTIGPKETMEKFSSSFKDWYFQIFKTSAHESKFI